MLSASPSAFAQAGADPAGLDGSVQAVAQAVESPEDDPADAELDVLMAPVALFPDPLLAAVLQASTVPLDVVMAARFLDDVAKDPAAMPDLRWDPAVQGLLMFPTVLQAMNAHLDWVQAVGDAVLTRLPDLQDSIQQVRAEFMAGGILASNERQMVLAEDGIISIVPVDPNQMFVPVYDPATLVETIPTTPSSDVAASAPQPAVSDTAASEPVPPPAAEPALPPAEAAAMQEQAAPLPQVADQPPSAPVSYAAPVAYAAPETSSVWPTVATLAGGAVVGGILGYAIGNDDDDDDDWHPHYDGDNAGDVAREIADSRQDRQDERLRYAEDARTERRQYSEDARSERAQYATMAREDRQAAKARQDGLRRAEAKNTQARLAQRSQIAAAEGRRPASLKTPSPLATRRTDSLARPATTPRLTQANATRPRTQAAPLPRQAKAGKAQASRPARPQAVGSARASEARLGGVGRGSTAKKQEIRGTRSRNKAAAASKPSRQKAGSARTSRKNAMSGGGSRGDKAKNSGKRGRSSRGR